MKNVKTTIKGILFLATVSSTFSLETTAKAHYILTNWQTGMVELHCDGGPKAGQSAKCFERSGDGFNQVNCTQEAADSFCAGVMAGGGDAVCHGNQGMTWEHTSSRPDISLWDFYDAEYLGCEGDCDPVEGNVSCHEKRSILCRYSAFSTPKPSGLRTTEWSGAPLGYTDPIEGDQILSREDGDNKCAESLGPNWVMAEFYDAGGDGIWGWGYGQGNGFTSSLGREFWVANEDEYSNCWDSDDSYFLCADRFVSGGGIFGGPSTPPPPAW